MRLCLPQNIVVRAWVGHRYEYGWEGSLGRSRMLLRSPLKRCWMEGVWELQARSTCYFIASHSPSKYLGPIFLTLHICFWVGVPLSFFCPETLDKTLHLGGEEELFEPHTPMMISFVILESYFFIILIANVLFIYLMCIKELEHRQFLTLGYCLSVGLGPFTCDLRLLCILYICLN